ncbi:hypothetical protein OA956_05185 [Bacteroidota bacterium]|nr:hypothetical protein [Bacteroidota bacterium]
MKKIFKFDNEPISGWVFFLRNILGLFGLLLIIPGIWIWAANGYKRAGTFNWSKDFRLICSFAVVIAQISNILSRDPSYSSTNLNMFDLIAIPCGILVFVMFVKNGNKKKNNNLEEMIQNNEI